jgi:hypothetical protein
LCGGFVDGEMRVEVRRRTAASFIGVEMDLTVGWELA